MEALKIGHTYLLTGPPIRHGNIPALINCQLKQHQTVMGQAQDFGNTVTERRQVLMIPRLDGQIYGYDMCSMPWTQFRGTYDHTTNTGEITVQSPAHCVKCNINTVFGCNGSTCPQCKSILYEGWLRTTPV